MLLGEVQLSRLVFLFFTLFLFFFFFNRSARTRPTRVNEWFLEEFGVIFFLALSWGLLFCACSLLTTLLWLEVAGLLALLLLGFNAYGSALTTPTAGVWGTRLLGEVGGQEIIHALLILLWVNGLATIFFLFG